MTPYRLSIETPAQTALLVIDLQVDFLSEQGRLPVDRARVPKLVDHVNAAIGEAQTRGILVVQVGNEFPRRSQTLLGVLATIRTSDRSCITTTALA